MWACPLAPTQRCVPAGLWGFLTFEFGLHAISAFGSGIFVSLTSPLLIVGTTYLAYKQGLEQLAKFMQARSLEGRDGTAGGCSWGHRRPEAGPGHRWAWGRDGPTLEGV